SAWRHRGMEDAREDDCAIRSAGFPARPRRPAAATETIGRCASSALHIMLLRQWFQDASVRSFISDCFRARLNRFLFANLLCSTAASKLGDLRPGHCIVL